jgi:hypothetical protein
MYYNVLKSVGTFYKILKRVRTVLNRSLTCSNGLKRVGTFYNILKRVRSVLKRSRTL